MKIKFIFAWYDIWVGVFIDKQKAWVYFFPLPTLGVILKFLPDKYKIVEESIYMFEMSKEVKIFQAYCGNSKVFKRSHSTWKECFKELRQYVMERNLI